VKPTKKRKEICVQVYLGLASLKMLPDAEIATSLYCSIRRGYAILAKEFLMTKMERYISAITR
jgi:hypothetical protein